MNPFHFCAARTFARILSVHVFMCEPCRHSVYNILAICTLMPAHTHIPSVWHPNGRRNSFRFPPHRSSSARLRHRHHHQHHCIIVSHNLCFISHPFFRHLPITQDIADTFEGNFKEQSGLNSNWLPVNSAQVRILCIYVCVYVCNHRRMQATEAMQ